MARRGDELRDHILWSAKEVFLEMGFERTSMDVVAAHASTSKRTLYAHFESKENLFLAVVDLARELFLEKLRTPADYAEEPTEAIILFCGRFLQLLVWKPFLRTCRLGTAEAERLPAASARYYGLFFATTQDRLASFISERWQISLTTSGDIAESLLGRTIYPRFVRTLFGVEPPLQNWLPDAPIAADVDLASIREDVAALLPSMSIGRP